MKYGFLCVAGPGPMPTNPSAAPAASRANKAGKNQKESRQGVADFHQAEFHGWSLYSVACRRQLTQVSEQLRHRQALHTAIGQRMTGEITTM